MSTNIEEINRDQLDRLVIANANEAVALRRLLDEANAALEVEREKYDHLVRVHDQLVELYFEWRESTTS